MLHFTSSIQLVFVKKVMTFSIPMAQAFSISNLNQVGQRPPERRYGSLPSEVVVGKEGITAVQEQSPLGWTQCNLRKQHQK